jgi:hypothetical protein
LHQRDSAPDSAQEVPHVGLMMVEDAPSTCLPAFDYAAIVTLFEDYAELMMEPTG